MMIAREVVYRAVCDVPGCGMIGYGMPTKEDAGKESVGRGWRCQKVGNREVFQCTTCGLMRRFPVGWKEVGTGAK